MIGDKVTVVVEVSKGQTVERSITAESMGGSVDWEVDKDDFLVVTERSRGGGTIRSEAFAMERVIRYAHEPRRQPSGG